MESIYEQLCNKTKDKYFQLYLDGRFGGPIIISRPIKMTPEEMMLMILSKNESIYLENFRRSLTTTYKHLNLKNENIKFMQIPKSILGFIHEPVYHMNYNLRYKYGR
mgnify:CR=1 FL=1